MSCMTTTMSAPPISASDARAAKAAGWSSAELRWERMQEAAHEAFRAGDAVAAARLWRRARWLAAFRLRRGDPRRATSLANAAMAARLAGREARARKLYARAIRLWAEVPGLIERIQPAPRARSSLFHLRMELRHRDAYLANWRTRMAGFVAEAGAALEALERGERPACRLIERWRGERPPVFDDARRLLGACLLIAAPPA